ncbi:hypothetical protein MATL_G00146600 [Megalops atlanticus]|uniref:Uncharacterized protein n=1 Tax=Megalops atlanticus TaxID=7932 RepID=A0A9D3PS79_MEGAT|nr:hypothetical protein MATL_G00146600 [Megalops atlanticus]
MSRGVLQPSQQKLAEKLTILNDRGIGMLTRIYNIKKVKDPGSGRRGPLCAVLATVCQFKNAYDGDSRLNLEAVAGTAG